MNTIIDSHAHLAWDSYEEDQEEVIQRALEKNVSQIVHAGVDLKSIPEMVKLADKYSQIFLGFGLHPHEAKFWSEEAGGTLSEALKHPKAVAVGECGLDYYYNHSERADQLKAFSAQVKLARQIDKPLIIHSRDAWEDTFKVLNEVGQGQVRGVFHCFTGSPDVLPQIEALDFYVSFSGIVTFKNSTDIQAAVPLVNRDRLLVETDCPYLAPHPYRGKRNEPAYVWMVAQKVADLRQVTLGAIAEITSANARRLFGLPEIR